MVRVAVVAPETLPPLIKLTVPFFHWYVRPVPEAVIEKLTELPTQAVLLVGSEVMIDPPMIKATLIEVSFGAHDPVITTL